jgi:pilus assembly protein CpaE
MSYNNPVMAIIAHLSDEAFARQVIDRNNGIEPIIVIGTPLDAIYTISNLPTPPRYLLIDIGERSEDILPEIDNIAEYCEPGTKVVVIGSINDVNFYRELKDRGVAEYFTRNARPEDIRNVLFKETLTTTKSKNNKNGDVVSFMSAASGDGSSTVALNTAYSLATDYEKSVVLVDMDYQFGMIAKNLDLATPFGIKELFDNPDRGIDATLIERMIVPYRDSNLKIIAAPNQLNYIPAVHNDLIFTLINTLKSEYDIVIIDLPHLWNPLVSNVLLQSKHTVMVAQLWLRSITHASRLINGWRSVGVKNTQISMVANRTGAKFKEAVTASDFERVCSIAFSCQLVNDTKSIMAAENNGKTLLEGTACDLSRQFRKFAANYAGAAAASKLFETNNTPQSQVRAKLASLLGKK